MKVIQTNDIDKNVITSFFRIHWGSSEMVISSGTFQCDTLDGFAVLNKDGHIIGLLTYMIDGEECEMISLDSLEEKRGIGTKLIKELEHTVKEQGCRRIRLITTNDNLHALGFYQKRGYQLVEMYPNAVERARLIKPEIPYYGDNGIPIRDEILLEKQG